MPPKQHSKISKFEWSLVQGVAWFIDGIQALFNGFAIGLAINRFITIFTALSLILYLKMRGVKIDLRTLAVFAIGGLLEFMPLVDTLPFWAGIVWRIKKWDQSA